MNKKTYLEFILSLIAQKIWNANLKGLKIRLRFKAKTHPDLEPFFSTLGFEMENSFRNLTDDIILIL